MYPILVFIFLFISWIIFSGKFDIFHLGLGVVSSLVVTWLSNDLLFHDRKMSISDRLKQVFAFLRYIPWITLEVVKANLHVLKLATTKKGYEEMSPRVVTFTTKLKTDFAKFVLANSITLTPGTISVETKKNKILVHYLEQNGFKDLLSGRMSTKVKNTGVS